jgi:hypothetical protein
MSYRVWLLIAAAALALAALLGWLSVVRTAVGYTYEDIIVGHGKRPGFYLLIGIILGFALIRLNARLIRSGISWWPGNIEHGDIHVHHAVFGLFGFIVAGVLEFVFQPVSPWVEVLAFVFGAGVGITLDEFALFLHVDDVYWQEEGRKSIDAVILGIVVTGLLVLGAVPLGLTESARDAAGPRWVIAALIGANLILVVIAFLKGRLWLGVIGLVLPPVAWLASVRLARPGSPWARRWYRDRPEVLAKALARDVAYRRRWGDLKERVWDAIGGAPTKRPT